MSPFRPYVYKKCLKFLKEFFKGDNPENHLRYLITRLRDKKSPWWKGYNCPYPSRREAEYAASVFARIKNSSASSESYERSKDQERIVEQIRENASRNFSAMKNPETGGTAGGSIGE